MSISARVARNAPARAAEPRIGRQGRGSDRRVLLLARITWVALYPSTLLLLLVGLGVQLATATAEGPANPAGAGDRAPAISLLVLEALVLTQYIVNTVVIAARRHDDWIGLFTSIDGLLFLVFVLPAVDALAATGGEWTGLAEAWQWLGAATQVPFLLFFPDGRLAPKRSALLVLGWPVAWAAVTILVPGGPGLLVTPSARLSIWLGFVAMCLATQVYRFRTTASQTQRQQTKWVLAGLWAAFIGVAFILPGRFVAADDLPQVFRPEIALPVLLIAADCLGVAFTLAILRYRLWDIDVVVRRTITYGTLVVLLGAAYAGAILALQTVFGDLITAGDPIPVALSTLLTAALFNPARHRLRRAVDRRFNRTHFDASRTIDAFGQRLRSDVAIESVLTDLVGVAVVAAQPAHVSAWIRNASGDASR